MQGTSECRPARRTATKPGVIENLFAHGRFPKQSLACRAALEVAPSRFLAEFHQSTVHVLRDSDGVTPPLVGEERSCQNQQQRDRPPSQGGELARKRYVEEPWVRWHAGLDPPLAELDPPVGG